MGKENIGKKIHDIRTKKNITQTELANLIHISPSSLCRWEKGLVDPSWESLEQICEVLNISITELLGQCESKKTSKITNTFKRKFIVILLLFLLSSLLLFFCIPKYRIIETSEYYIENQGKTVVVYVIPFLKLNEEKASLYSKKLVDKYIKKNDPNAVEIWFIPSKKSIGIYEEAFLIITHIVKEVSTE